LANTTDRFLMALPLLIRAPRAKPDRSAAEIVPPDIIGGARLKRY